MSKQNFRITLLLIFLFFVGLIAIFFVYKEKKNYLKKDIVPIPTIVVREKVKVIRVIDGDTIVIEGNIKVRYIGMNTPELVDPRKSLQCFSVEASDKNKELVLGKEIEMEKDISEIDKYGRLLRYVYVDGIMINKLLIDEGFANIDTVVPDIKYKEIFKEAEKQARSENIGLWEKCKK